MNDKEVKVKSHAFSCKAHCEWGKLDFLHITAAAGMNINWKASDCFSEDKNMIRDFQTLLKVDVFPFRNIHVYADCSQTFHEISSADYACSTFLNAGMKYTIMRNLALKASATNLLGNRYYKESVYDGVNYMYYELTLRGREFLLAVNLRF